ncbi:serine protease [Chloroflexota bacterium]
MLKIDGVAGVGVGHNVGSNPTIIIFTETPGVRGLPTFLDGVPVIVQFSGKFFANPKPDKPGKPPKPEEPDLTPKDRWDRPVPIGVSTGHPDVTAGTIGARVTNGTNVYALSNNHVYANENKASIGDAVIQPGTYDGGISPDDNIGTLSAYVPIDFNGGINYIDAAIASTTTALLGNSTPSDGYGTPMATITGASIGMKVKKYGRTTGETNGRVYAVNATVDVQYDSGVARFENQIVVTPGAFSAGGDSGSLIVVNNKRSSDHLKPVGLLFAGSSLYTIANPIGTVLESFGVTIDGE